MCDQITMGTSIIEYIFFFTETSNYFLLTKYVDYFCCCCIFIPLFYAHDLRSTKRIRDIAIRMRFKSLALINDLICNDFFFLTKITTATTSAYLIYETFAGFIMLLNQRPLIRMNSDEIDLECKETCDIVC